MLVAVHIVVAFLWSALPPQQSQEAGVTVIGRKRPDNKRDFVWIIRNNTMKSIDLVEVDHYEGTQLFKPPDWVETHRTGKVGIGIKPEPGKIRIEAKTKDARIHPKEKLRFGLRLSHRGGYVAPGTVRIGFSDGTELVLKDVPCPARPPFWLKHFPLIGLSVMFAMFLAAEILLDRRRRRRSASETAQPQS